MNPMFYFLLALTAILATTANAGGPVLDIEGNIIFGGSYYVIPVFFGADGGGLTLSPLGNKQCPLYIGQEPSEANMGIPVRFSNWKSRVGFVPESENLNIPMDVKATICVHFFQIKKDGDSSNGYNIVFCPNDKDCIDVGIFVDKDGVRRLALSSTPFPVMFLNSTDETETSLSNTTAPHNFYRLGFVPESESLSIEMDTKATICGQSTYWWVAAPDMPKMLFVTAGPNPKEHVEDSRRSFFQIKKAEDFRIGYKIVFCPQDNYCMDVGIHEDDNHGIRRLALSSEPFSVRFVKAYGTEISYKTMSII
ncbi:unnamed protein product [Brassica napus]|uniref:(rape) hypothetical protein n=1 Tax=Brassica napus TaxID=3708 RepID=A0A816Z969_BRANA|nr:unnamed protein product [Brassica napus]